MASLLDTVGGYQFSLGLPGAQASNSLAEFDTFFNESSSGGIDSAGALDFGVVAAKGTADNGCILLTTSGTPVGITSRVRGSLNSATAPSNVIGIKTGQAVGIFRTGDVVCMAAENVKFNDEVVALATAYSPSAGISTNVGGASGGVADGSSRIKVAGHIWQTTTAQGKLGVVSVFSRAIAPATTS